MQRVHVGDSASLSKTVTGQEVEAFARLSMDDNPLHLDEEYARSSIFGGRVAHGLLVSSFISAVIARKLPGTGSIYLSQELQFLKPVFLGDTITATVTVEEIPKPSRVRLATTCTNQHGDTVVRGTALVKPPAGGE